MLHHLVQNAGRLVPKEELFEAVWPNVVVGDDSLVQCIRELRQKLGDDEHRLIKTVSRRGYVLDAASRPPELGDPARPAPPIWDHLEPGFRKGLRAVTANLVVLFQLVRGMGWQAAAAGILVCASAAAIYVFSPASVPVKRTQPAGKELSSPRPTFKDCNVCPEMVELPAGDFMMGSPVDERGHEPIEGLPRPVVIARRFALGRFEVTVEQFEAFVAETGHRVGNSCRKINIDTGRWDPPADGSFRQPGFDVLASHPVVCVSWHETQTYLAWLGRRTGRPYRLPSEAEWEYAARAGTTTSYSFGSDESELCRYARFADLASRFPWGGGCRSSVAIHGPIQVGMLKPNRWGLFDMHGNAWEWVADCWTPDAQQIPTDGSAFTRHGGCEVGVIRGGGWAAEYRRVRSAQRVPMAALWRQYHVGFRVALSLGP